MTNQYLFAIVSWLVMSTLFFLFFKIYANFIIYYFCIIPHHFLIFIITHSELDHGPLLARPNVCSYLYDHLRRESFDEVSEVEAEDGWSVAVSPLSTLLLEPASSSTEVGVPGALRPFTLPSALSSRCTNRSTSDFFIPRPAAAVR